jgi:hypothetical protein
MRYKLEQGPQVELRAAFSKAKTTNSTKEHQVCYTPSNMVHVKAPRAIDRPIYPFKYYEGRCSSRICS